MSLLYLRDERYLLNHARNATLEKDAPVCTGEVEPVWAHPLFSYRFTGQVPLEVYESWAEMETHESDSF